MNTIKKILVAGGLLCGAATMLNAAPIPMQGEVKFYKDAYQSGNGGEFSADILNFGESRPKVDMISFCLEVNEHLNYSSTFDYTISDQAYNGGKGNPAPTPTGGDMLSKGSAYLYELFHLGTLTDYFTADRKNNAGALQNALWYLEDEISYSKAGGAGNKFLAQVISAFSTGGSAADTLALSKGNYDSSLSNVRVMNIKYKSGKLGQSQIVYLTPDGGLTLLMLGGAISMLAVARRRFA